MKFIKNNNELLIINLVFLFVGLYFSTSSYGVDLTCGNTKIEYTANYNSAYGYEKVNGKIIFDGIKVMSEFSYEWVHFSIICFSNDDHEKFIVYKAYCGGSGCDDSSNYGIINAETGRVLLKPSSGNCTKAKIILKKLPSELD